MKKKKILAIIVVIVTVIAIGGYFAFSKKDILPKGNMTYEKKIVENSEEIKEQTETVNSNDALDSNNSETSIANEKKDEIVLSPEEKNSTIEKKPIDEVEEDSSGKIVDRLMTTGFQKSSGRKIDTVILHTSYNAIGDDPYDIGDIIKQYEQYEVSAHYLIGRDGTIYRLVEDKDIAWHAGLSKMPDGRTNINDFSIGIEVVNTKEGKFSDAQYKSLNSLVKDLKEKYPIKNILGHDDIAPSRKTDPWGIEWNKVEK